MGHRSRDALRGRAASRAGHRPEEPVRHRVRRRRADTSGRRGRGAAGRGRASGRSPGPIARGRRPRPRDGDRRRRGGREDRRAGRRERGDGRPQGVPARQRAQSHQPQRAVHGDHREHHRWGHDRGARAVGDDRAALGRADRRDRAAPDGSRLEDRHRLREARAEGGVRPSRRRGHDRSRPQREADARGARRARAHVLQDRTDPVHATRPVATGVHHRARAAAGQRAAVVRGAGRPGDGTGARASRGKTSSIMSIRNRSRPARSPRCTGRCSRTARRPSSRCSAPTRGS